VRIVCCLCSPSTVVAIFNVRGVPRRPEINGYTNFLDNLSHTARPAGNYSILHAPPMPLPIIVLGTMILSYSSAWTLPEAMAASLRVVPSAAAFSAICAAFW
jgi:hypothetical protein